MAESNKDSLPGWGWPLAVVVVVHLALAAIPIEFSEAHSEERPAVALAMTAPPEPQPDEPVEEFEWPELEAEPEPEVGPEPQPQPEPEPPVEAVEPENSADDSEVAIAEELPEPPAEEPPVEEEPVERQEVERDFEPEALSLPHRDIRQHRTTEPEPTAEPVDWQGYGRGVMQAVQSEQNYPRMARRMGWEGTATVRITVDRHGRLAGAPDLVDSSNHSALDEEALKMVKAAAPFDNFPGAADEEEREFVIPVRFRLQG